MIVELEDGSGTEEKSIAFEQAQTFTLSDERAIEIASIGALVRPMWPLESKLSLIFHLHSLQLSLSTVSPSDSAYTVTPSIIQRSKIRKLKIWLILQLTDINDSPRDIEWAVVSGNIYLLQSRPVTSFLRESDFEFRHHFNSGLYTNREILSRANIELVHFRTKS